MATMPIARPETPNAKRQHSNSRLANPYVYLIPAMLIMSVMTYYPMAYGLWMSFTDYALKNLRIDSPPPNFVGLQNFIDIATGALTIPNFDFAYTVAFNLFWTFSNVTVHVIIGVLIAVLLNARGLWFRGVYRAIFVLPIVIPTLVVANVWRNMFDPDFGAINQGLAALGGLIGMPASAFHIRWIESLDPPIPFLPLPLAYFALLITNVWLGWPFMTIVATGALQSIPRDYYEAASMDGASPTQQFFGITVPLLRPAMVPAIVYGITLTFNLFNLIYFVSGGGPLRQTEILVTTAFRLVNQERLYGIAAAFAVYTAIILLVITLITNRVSRATESYDA
ncbi:MAG: sugar ABC transporter permease [Chloroflexi bacterium]|nr:sugar ABC transporter permease [Chloroflexota bacterium]